MAKKLIAHVNTTIKNSIFYQILLGIYESKSIFVLLKLWAILCCFYFFLSTALKALFSSFTPKALTIKVVAYGSIFTVFL